MSFITRRRHMKIASNSSYGLECSTWLQNAGSGLPFGVRLLMALKCGSFVAVDSKFASFRSPRILLWSWAARSRKT